MNDQPVTTAAPKPRKVRSFVRRPGRITAAQKRALANLLPTFGVGELGKPLDLVALFGRDAPRVLDIGFGDGEALVTSAANNPGIDYLGVEVHEPGVGHLLLLLERAALANIRIVVHDAADVVAGQLADGCIDAVNLFFPDPWPKKRHHKRRLVQTPFLAEISRVLAPGGLLHVTTDWPDYARHTRETVAASGAFAPVEPPAVAADPLAFRAPTKFERRGRRLGHEITELYYRKQGSSRR